MDNKFPVFLRKIRIDFVKKGVPDNVRLLYQLRHDAKLNEQALKQKIAPIAQLGAR